MNTTMSSREMKENETKLHDRLFKNLKLLTFISPASKDLEAVLCKDMFAKSNRAAFQQVTYYLFTILDPQLTREKIVTWPLYDIKLESKFRSEVVIFINEIRSKYEEANLPNIMPSQFLTPGGYKFVKFMLSLSNFVLYTHLKKNEKFGHELIAPIKAHDNPKVTNLILKNVKLKTSGIEMKNINMLKRFQQQFDIAIRQANSILEEQKEMECELFAVNKKLENKKTHSNSGNYEDINQRLNTIKAKTVTMHKIQKLCEKGNELLSYLSSDQLVLDFSEESVQLPDSIRHLFKTVEDKLDLLHLFNSLIILLENECFGMTTFTEDQLDDFIKLLTEWNERCTELDQHLTRDEEELSELMENFRLEMDCK